MYSGKTLHHITEFLRILAKCWPQCPLDTPTLVNGCVIAMSQPESVLWCPSCVAFTRFVLLLVEPSNKDCQREFVSSFLSLQDCFSHQTVAKSWDWYTFGVVSFDDKLLIIPKKIWGVSVDYVRVIDAIKPLALPSVKPMTRLDRVRSFHQLLGSTLPVDTAGPLTVEGSDLDLMIYIYGDQYYRFGQLRALIAEEYGNKDRWILDLEHFVSDIVAEMTKIRNLETMVPDPELQATFPILKDSLTIKIFSYIAENSKSPCIRRTIRSSKTTILKIIDTIQQYYLDIVVRYPAPRFNLSREVAQMARDITRGGNLALISAVDSIIRARGKETKINSARHLCAIFAAQLCQLPSPEFFKRLPDPFAQMSLEILRESCRLRELVFLRILMQDFQELGIEDTPKLRKALSKALGTLPLYLETKGITAVTERICMVASHFAPVDFDQLDMVYDKVIYLLVRDDRRINRLLYSLQDTMAEIFDRRGQAKQLVPMEFMPIVERLCNMVTTIFGVYNPIFDAIYEQSFCS